MSYWKNKRVMVTGGGGFLGSHVVEKLRLAGCTQVCVVEHRDFDLSKADQVQRLFQEQRVDVLLHMAGLVGGIAANKARPVDFFYQNLMMNTLTLHHAWQAGVSKVVAAGAGCGYPEHAPLPLRETNFWDGFPQAESAPYSLAKRMLHVQSIAYWAQHRLPMIVTVPGNIYGPYDNFDLENAHVVPALIRKFVEASEAKRERLVVWGSGGADARLRLCRGRRRGHPAGRGDLRPVGAGQPRLGPGGKHPQRGGRPQGNQRVPRRGRLGRDAARRPVPSRL